MADEAPKLIQIAPKGGEKKDGFNLVTERVVAVNPESKQLEVELLAYDGKTVVLDVAEEALDDLKTELDPMDFGSLVHDVLQEMAQDEAMRCCSSRAVMSTPPPGGNGTTTRIGFDGYC